MDFLFAGTKKVAIVERWPLVEVQLIVLQIAAVVVSLSLFTFVFSELSLLTVSEKRAQ